jgi:hypothetical protein
MPSVKPMLDHWIIIIELHALPPGERVKIAPFNIGSYFHYAIIPKQTLQNRYFLASTLERINSDVILQGLGRKKRPCKISLARSVF